MKQTRWQYLLFLFFFLLLNACSSEPASQSSDDNPPDDNTSDDNTSDDNPPVFTIAETCSLTEKELDYFSASERTLILSLDETELISKGFEYLGDQEIQKSKVCFKCASFEGDENISDERDISKLLYTIVSLGTVIADLKTDDSNDALEDLGDIIEKFSCEFDGNFMTSFELVASVFTDATNDISCSDDNPAIAPGSTMTIRELQNLLDLIIADIEDVVLKLDTVSNFNYNISLINFSWIIPEEDRDTTSDALFDIAYPISQSDIYLLRSTLKTLLSSLMLINANDLHIDGFFNLEMDATADASSDINDFLGFVNGYNSLQDIFDTNPNLLKIRKASHLKKAQTYLTTAIDDFKDLIDTIGNSPGDSEYDNLITTAIGILDTNPFADKTTEIKTVLSAVQDCLNNTCSIKSLLETINDASTDAVLELPIELKVDFTRLFDGHIDIREMLPNIVENNVNGFLPSPTLNGFIVDVSGDTGGALVNLIDTDENEDGTADILEM